jgi:flagellar protein FlaG
MNIDKLNNVSNDVSSKVKPVEIKPVKTEKIFENKGKLEVDKNLQEVSEEMMKKSIKQANVALKQHNRRIDRSVHEVTKTVMYKMVDTETKEVIKEFPPRKIQDMIAKMWELAGLFVDEQI